MGTLCTTEPREVVAVSTDKESKVTTVELALPGVKADDLSIEVDRGVLTITGQRTWAKPDNHKILRQEFGGTTVKQRYRLGEDIDASNISAKFEAGILQVSLPRKADLGAKKIQVN